MKYDCFYKYFNVELADKECVEQITVYLNINENDIPASPTTSEGMGNFINNRRQSIEDSESQDLIWFGSCNNSSRKQHVEDRPSFRQLIFSDGKNISNSNDAEIKNTTQLPSVSRDEVSSNSLSRDGLIGTCR